MSTPVSMECTMEAKSNSNFTKLNVQSIKLSKEILKELHDNAFHGYASEDLVDHIIKVLEILDLINTPDVDTNRLRIIAFPILLDDDSKMADLNELNYWPIDQSWHEDGEYDEHPICFDFNASCNNNIPKSGNRYDTVSYNDVCMIKKFEVVKYHLGPHEEYYATKPISNKKWDRNEDSFTPYGYLLGIRKEFVVKFKKAGSGQLR
ncbi:hypothetical protein Tco_1376679 [Tanacetum coccineum]